MLFRLLCLKLIDFTIFFLTKFRKIFALKIEEVPQNKSATLNSFYPYDMVIPKANAHKNSLLGTGKGSYELGTVIGYSDLKSKTPKVQVSYFNLAEPKVSEIKFHRPEELFLLVSPLKVLLGADIQKIKPEDISINDQNSDDDDDGGSFTKH